ncbi:MAG: NAD(P)/FAD-dependent oxidoreductase [Anaerolineales bacterium]
MKATLNKEESIIIGGGPAGMISAIQLKRYGITAPLFEANRLGGLLWNANLVENYPGFPGGIPGPKLVERFAQQFESHSLEAIYQRVLEVDYDPNGFIVATDGNTYISRTLVVATGTRPKTFPVEFIPDAGLEKVFYEVAPLLDVRDKTIAVIGAGDAAFDYAINLSRKNRVVILNRTQQIKALPLLVQRCAKIQNIEYFQGVTVSSVLVEANKLLLKTTSQHKNMFHADFLIGAIGREENPPLMSNRMREEAPNLVKSGRLHVVGDVQNGIYRQTAIAVGDGLKAAMKIYQFLKE